MVQLACREIRIPMFVASIVQTIFAIAVVIVGAATMGMCTKERHGDWGMVYGSVLFASSAITMAAIHGRQRRTGLFSLGLGIVTAVIFLFLDALSYFCLHFRDGVNRYRKLCEANMEKLNSCAWATSWQEGFDHFEHDQPTRIVLLVLVTMHLVFGAGLLTSAMTEAGRTDLCQFEEALRELQEANAQLSYRKRARRNRILTQYISRAKPEESQSYPTKILRFFGFGTDVEPIPVTQRKVKIFLPPGARVPSSRSERK